MDRVKNDDLSLCSEAGGGGVYNGKFVFGYIVSEVGF